jgi:hypothetical protein
MLYLGLGLFGFIVGIFGFNRGSGQAAVSIAESLPYGAAGFRTEPVAVLYEFARTAGSSLGGLNSTPSTILIVLIVASILFAFLTYFGIILLRIFKND